MAGVDGVIIDALCYNCQCTGHVLCNCLPLTEERCKERRAKRNDRRLGVVQTQMGYTLSQTLGILAPAKIFPKNVDRILLDTGSIDNAFNN